jgi:hypothetical protein
VNQTRVKNHHHWARSAPCHMRYGRWSCPTRWKSRPRVPLAHRAALDKFFTSQLSEETAKTGITLEEMIMKAEEWYDRQKRKKWWWIVDSDKNWSSTW